MKTAHKDFICVALITALISLSSVSYADGIDYSDLRRENHTLEIPDNVQSDRVISSDDLMNIHKEENIVTLVNDKGESYSGSGIVENEITSIADDGILGTTTYKVNLSDVEKVATENTFASAISSIFLPVAYAGTVNNSSSNSTWDSTVSVQLTMTVEWKKYDSQKINITKVSGSYSIADRSVSVTGSDVLVGQGMNGEEQHKTFYPGTRRQWSYNTGFNRVEDVGWATRKYAKYTAYLKRNNSSWTAVLDNIVG